MHLNIITLFAAMQKKLHEELNSIGYELIARCLQSFQSDFGTEILGCMYLFFLSAGLLFCHIAKRNVTIRQNVVRYYSIVPLTLNQKTG